MKTLFINSYISFFLHFDCCLQFYSIIAVEFQEGIEPCLLQFNRYFNKAYLFRVDLKDDNLLSSVNDNFYLICFSQLDWTVNYPWKTMNVYTSFLCIQAKTI